MYESYFQLKSCPFGMNSDARRIYMTQSHREAFAGLLYAISRRKGFVVLTGDAGTGKTSLLRALIRSVSTAKFSVVFTPRVNIDDFLELVLLDFGVTEIPGSKSQRIAKLQDVLFELRFRGNAPVLMVDEAHTLSPETLEEIRLLTNFETAEEKCLQIILAGQNELAATLNRQDLRQLKQRIEVRMELKALPPGEVEPYVWYRWSRAGGEAPLPFSAEAMGLIARASRGIPRVVNCICDNALLLAYAGDEPIIGTAHIYDVLRDLDINEAETASTGQTAANAADLTGWPGKGEPPVRAGGGPQWLMEEVEEEVAPFTEPPLTVSWADFLPPGSTRFRRPKP